MKLICLCAFGAFFVASAGLATPDAFCIRAMTVLPVPNTSNFLELKTRMDRELLNLMPRDRKVIWPKSFQSQFGRKEKWRSLEAAVKLGKISKSAVPEQVNRMSQTYQQNGDLKDYTSDFIGLLKDEYGYTSMNQRDVEQGIEGLQSEWDQLVQQTSFTDIKIEHVASQLSRYRDHFIDLRSRYPELLGEDVAYGGGFGQLATQVIAESLETHSKTYKSLFSLSLLHPLLDNAIDQGKDISGTLRKIADLLAGHPVVAENRFESLVFELIGTMKTEFPEADHPVFGEILRQLHWAQMESAHIQRDPHASLEDILKITYEKGGYTALAYAYTTLGTLSTEETQFYYKMGALFQLCDDLLDYKEDLEQGTHTVWTRTLGKENSRFYGLALLNRLEMDLEREGEGFLKNHPLKEKLLASLRSGYRFYLFSAYVNSTVGPILEPALKDKFPFDAKNMKNVTMQVLTYIQHAKAQDPEFQNMLSYLVPTLDQHFLKNGYKDYVTQNPNSWKEPLKIKSHSPFYYTVKVTNAFTRFFTETFAPNRHPTIRELRVWIPTLLIATDIYSVGTLQGPDWLRPTAGVVGATLLMNIRNPQFRYYVVLYSMAVSVLTLMQ